MGKGRGERGKEEEKHKLIPSYICNLPFYLYSFILFVFFIKGGRTKHMQPFSTYDSGDTGDDRSQW